MHACVTAAETVCYTELTWNKSMLQRRKPAKELLEMLFDMGFPFSVFVFSYRPCFLYACFLLLCFLLCKETGSNAGNQNNRMTMMVRRYCLVLLGETDRYFH